ncbi:hypothetical protein DPEC_G00143860 [Dallia pectoralis]|uniref:Uncharacterized protein n=1 Tax=Dallia pectoralis TaxID=75939 RepID=A0ACC2GP13_DALPE|nr:hypothetical protein DPEC_G00143860 [Dallia pectoralis]
MDMPMDRNKKRYEYRERKNIVNVESKGTVTVINEGPEKVKRKRTVTLENTTKSQSNPAKQTGGRGLGKAGARRLGQLLKRAIQEKEHVTGHKTVPLPKTPVRLFKYQTQTEIGSPSKTTDARHVTRVSSVSQLILRVISQCKHQGGISMVELKDALAAGGYDVTKNSTRVNLAVKGMVTKETLVQTAGATGSFKLNKKAMTDNKRIRTRGCDAAIKAKQKKENLNSATVGIENSLRPTRKAFNDGIKTAKPVGKSQKPDAKTPACRRAVGKSQRAVRDRPKQVGKGHKLAGQLSNDQPTSRDKTAKPPGVHKKQ